MRSLMLTKNEDLAVRQMAHEAGVRVGELIRAAVAARLGDWEKDSSDAMLDADLAAVNSKIGGR